MVTAMLLLFTVCVSQFYITSCSPEQESLEEFLSLLKSESLALSPIGKQVAEDLENDDDVQLHAEDELCKITQMHGFQDRQGILPFENNQKKYQNKISNFLDRWHEKRHQNKAYVPPVLQRSCHPIISHKYKFIYFGMPKTASRTTSAYFENIACNGTKEEDCFLRVYDAKTLKKEEYLKYYDEYFKFAFIRNPYARAASVYFMIAQGEKNGQHFYMRTDNGEKCAPPFHQHCLDPYKLKELCGKHYKGIQTNNTMGDCCCHLKEEWIEQSFLDQHFMPQAPCIFDHEGKITVDFIGRFEYFKQDFKAIVEEINKRSENKIELPEEFNSIGVRSQIDTSTERCERVSQLYLGLYAKFPECLTQMRKYYYIDLKLLKFYN